MAAGDEVTKETCEASEPFASEGFANISQHWASCTLPEGYDFNPNFNLNSVNITQLANGTFCEANDDHPAAADPILAVRCYVEEDYVESCETTDGKHTVTFWVYFVLYCVYTLGMNSMYALLDGTALHLANQHDSDYSYVMMWNILGAACAPIVTAFTIEDPLPGGEPAFSSNKF